MPYVLTSSRLASTTARVAPTIGLSQHAQMAFRPLSGPNLVSMSVTSAYACRSVLGTTSRSSGSISSMRGNASITYLSWS